MAVLEGEKKPEPKPVEPVVEKEASDEINSAQADEEVPIVALQESPVREHQAELKDEEEPMEQEESNPVIEEEDDTGSQVRLVHLVFEMFGFED